MDLIQKPYLGINLNKNHPLARGLIGCWVMNEGSGDKVFDLSRNGNDGTFDSTTPPYWKSGAIQFDADNDHIDLPNITISKTGQFSIFCRQLFDDTTTDHALVGFDETSLGSSHQLWMDNATPDHFAVAIYDSDWQIRYGDIIPIANTWYTWGMIYNNGTSKLYVNGEQDGADLSATVDNNFVFTKLGILETLGKDHKGLIEWVYLYDQELKASEIAWLHRDPYVMFDYEMPPWMFYTETAGGLSIPIAMYNRQNQ